MLDVEKCKGKCMKLQWNVRKVSMSVFIACILFFIGIRIGLDNYLLFHTSIEMFCTLISFGILVIALNTYSNSKNSSLTFLGIGYGFVGVLDIVHSLSYKGMNILPRVTTANIPTQFWIAARYMEASIILVALILVYKSIKNIAPLKVLGSFFLITTIISLTILKWNTFPDCFVEGTGLTTFKVISEHIIILILLCSLVFLFKIRKSLDHEICMFMALSVIFTIISEVCFMVYNDVYVISNMMGYNFKALSFYCIYKAIIEIGLRNPYKDLFNKLNDISERLQEESNHRMTMEKIILENNECYDLLIDNSKDAIFIHVDEKIIFANDALVSLIGAASFKEVVSRKVINLMPIDIREDITRRMRDRYSKKVLKDIYETKLLKDTGEVIDIELRAAYFNYKGTGAGLVIVRDITSQKQVEKLKIDIFKSNEKLKETQDFNKLITEFFSNISHELKTPLNVILGAVQVMELYYSKENYIYSNQDKHLKVMKQNCYRLLRLVNNLIDLSKIDSGFLKLNLSNHNIVNIVEEITLSVAEYIENKGVILIFDTDVEERIMAVDPDKIERIMLNLLSNAIKFTNPKDKILVSMTNREDWIVISVKDTGIGIPEDKLKVIFERFGQVENTLKRNKEGSGIGLALVKSLVDLHQGKISIKSILGKGSEFIIELPTKLVASENQNNMSNLCEDKVERISIEFSDIYS